MRSSNPSGFFWGVGIFLVALMIWSSGVFESFDESTAPALNADYADQYASNSYDWDHGQVYDDDGIDEDIIYPFPRFSDPHLTYYYNESCIGPIKKRLEYAFKNITFITNGVLSFAEASSMDEASILIDCSDNAIYSGGMQTLAEGGPLWIYKDRNEIVQSSTEFTQVNNRSSTYSCSDFPSVEIHELFHALGIAHSTRKDDIMAPYIDKSDCWKYKENLVQRYGICLQDLYSGFDVKESCAGVNFTKLEAA